MAKAIDFDTVRKLASELGEIDEPRMKQGIEEPAIKLRGKLLAWTPPHKSMEPYTLAVSIDKDIRAELIAAAPDVYFVTNHYLNYPAVLVRLTHIPPDALKDLLRMALNFVNKEPLKKKRAARPALIRKRGSKIL